MIDRQRAPETGRQKLDEVPHGLRSRLIALSEAKNWEEARQEWRLVNVRRDDGGDVCLCGRAIHWIHLIGNARNGNRTVVGGGCAGTVLNAAERAFMARMHKANGVHERPDGELAPVDWVDVAASALVRNGVKGKALRAIVCKGDGSDRYGDGASVTDDPTNLD